MTVEIHRDGKLWRWLITRAGRFVQDGYTAGNRAAALREARMWIANNGGAL